MVEHWLLGGVTLLGGLVGLAATGRNPEGLSAQITSAPDWWPFDLPSWRALVRIAPLGAAEGVVWGGWFIADGLPDSALVDAAETLLQVLVVLAIGLMVAVALWNRPRALVSPPLRHLPGALQEWSDQGDG